METELSVPEVTIITKPVCPIGTFTAYQTDSFQSVCPPLTVKQGLK